MRRVAASSTTPNLELPKMNRKNAILATALGGLLALNVATQAHAAEDAGAKEKCYGVAKAGKNDCATNAHGCATEAKKDRDPSEWINVPKGTCDKIAGGKTTPGK